MNLYLYEGPVMEFDRCIANKWKDFTYASSERKAISNLVYRYKKKHGKQSTAKITLPGKLECVPEQELKGDRR